jgi:hypothetical protein
VDLHGGLRGENSGRGLSWDAALGATLTPKLVLFANLFDAEISGINEPTVRGIGIGAAYFLDAIDVGPSNAFVSATIAAARISAIPGGQQSGSYADGPGARVAVGYEWRMARHCSLGFAGGLVIARARAYETNWAGTGYFLVASLGFG